MSNGYGSSSSSPSARILSTSTSSGLNGKNINNFSIDTSSMPATAIIRGFTVSGLPKSKFKIIVLQNPASSSDQTKYYNWKEKSFAAGHNSLHNDLIALLTGNTYRNNITFPSGAGEFVIKLISIDNNEKPNIITKNISKVGTDTTVTFAPASASSDNYTTVADLTAAAQPTVTSVGAVNSNADVEFNWDVINRSHADFGFGLRLTGDFNKITDKFWYFETTENVADNILGDGEDNIEVTVASTADLCVGMELTYHKSTTVPTNKAGSAVGTTTIKSIGTAANSSGNFTITFSQAVAFEDGETMTFRAYGKELIKDAIDLNLEFVLYPKVTPTTLTKTVRANVSASQNVTLTDTLGLAGGNHVTYKGLGVNNASANAVTSVTQDFDGSDTDGVAVVQLAQTLSAGTKLTFKGCHKIINFTGILKIKQFPAANKTVYLDLDKLITVGTNA